MKNHTWIKPLCLGGVFLIIYPAVFAADVMGLAAEPNPKVDVSLVVSLAWQGFLWGTLLYPVVYLSCAILAFACYRRANHRLAFNLARLPLWYLAAIAAPLAAMVSLSLILLLASLCN
jgi:uncharacterized membrane protein